MPDVFITCAITGAGDTVGKSDKVPFTPEAIANDARADLSVGDKAPEFSATTVNGQTGKLM